MMRLSSLFWPQCTPCAWRGSSSRGSWWGRSSSCTDSSRADRGRRAQRSTWRARRGRPVATPTTPAYTHRPALDRENSVSRYQWLMTTSPVTPASMSQWEMMSTQLASVTQAPPHTSSITERISASENQVNLQSSVTYIHHHSNSYQGLFLAFSVQRKELKSK